MVLGIYCCGGFGGVIEGLAKELDLWEKIVFIDDVVKGDNIMTFDVFCDTYSTEIAEIIISSGEPIVRKTLFDRVKKAGYKLPNLIHHFTDISVLPDLGEGNIFLAFSSVAPNKVTIGNNNIIMAQTRIGHDVTIGNNCVIATSVSIAGNVYIDNNCYLGLGAKIREGISIGMNSVVGMGAIVVNSVHNNTVVVGIPAKEKKKETDYIFKSHNKLK